MSSNRGLATTKRRVDEWLAARPQATAVIYFTTLTTVWASAEFLLGRHGLPRAVLSGGLFGSIYVALAWFWGDLGDAAEE